MKSGARTATAFVAITGLAVGLTVTRLPFRWNQIALAYASYFREYRRVIDLEGWTAAFTTFVGIHPPAYSLLFLTMMESSPRTWFLISGLFSVSAVALLFATGRQADPRLRVAAAAGLLLASSPHRLAYALEPNNYPLLLLVTAGSMFAFARWIRGRGGAGALLYVTVLGLWTHALFVTVPVAQALAVARDPTRRRWAAGGLGVAFLLCSPLLPGVLDAAGSGMNDTPPLGDVGRALFVTLPARFGGPFPAWGVLALAVAGAFVRAPSEGAAPTGWPAEGVLTRSWLLQILLGGAVLALALVRGTAATWQFPYYLLLLAPVFLLAARPLRGPPLVRGLAAVGIGAILVGNLTWTMAESRRARSAWRGAHLTHALVDRAVQHWTPGSSLVAIHFPDYSDDDKDALDPAFAHIPMGLPISLTDPDVPTLVGADPYWGQPVRYPGDRWLYTFTAVDPERLTVIADAVGAQGAQLIVVVWNTDVAPEELTKLEQWASGRGRTPERDRSQALWMFLR